MSRTRRGHGAARPNRPRPNPRAIPKRAPRPSARLTGGPLDQLTVRVERGIADRGVFLVEGHRGRYVRVDADHWAWERDHQPAHTTRPR